ncbi:uncharacterized protein LOC112041253, partial [Lingula anatina]|uniref:Uncharacterized protein LOC112041253 n=1 Tax=Lingula anatina TaxID=7574 RepID=A0A2R2MK33_LINAN
MGLWSFLVLPVMTMLYLMITTVSEGTPFDSRGREFYLMFMEHKVTTPQSFGEMLIITNAAREPVTVNITSNHPGIDTTFTIAVDAHETTRFSQDLRMTDTRLAPKAVHVVSTGDIVVQGVSNEDRSTDMFLGLPLDTYGTEYVTVCYSPPFIACQFGVVATEDDTNVTMHFPSAAFSGDPSSAFLNITGAVIAGNTATVNMMKFDSLQVQSTAELTGTLIRSTAPVSVFSGNVDTQVDVSVGGAVSKDHLVQQLPPVQALGKEFLTVPIPEKTIFKRGDVFRTVTTTNDTELIGDINHNIMRITGAYKFTQFNLGGTNNLYTSLKTTNPIILAEFIQSQYNTMEPSDPSMIYIPPVQQFESEYIFTALTSSPSSGKPYVNLLILLAQDNDTSNIFLDGVALNTANFPSLAWYPISHTNYFGAYIEVQNGTHRLYHALPNRRFGAVLYGNVKTDTVSGETYATPLGMRASRINMACTATPDNWSETSYIGDGIDNDCDGEVDEELCISGNTQDDDGDGHVNEDCATPYPVDGTYGPWGAYSSCSTTCGPGTQSRTRVCTSKYGGAPCAGLSTETISCNLGGCPVNGAWGQWSPWSTCSTSCRSGTSQRTRQCDSPPPSNGGSGCSGNNVETITCNANVPCPDPADTLGTEFLLLFQENHIIHSPGLPLKVFITNPNTEAVTVTIDTPAATGLTYYHSVTFSIPPSSSTVKLLSNELRMTGSAKSKKGIRVSSTKDVTVAGMNKEYLSTDSFVVIPTDHLGTKHFGICAFPTGRGCQIGITTKLDNTHVNITLPPSPNIVSGRKRRATTYDGITKSPGDIISVSLGPYESVQIQSGDDLSGARIDSDNPVAVFSGNVQVQIGLGTAQDHAVDQILPTETWGKKFVTVPIPERTIYKPGDMFKIIGSQSNTTVDVIHMADVKRYTIPNEGDVLQIITGAGLDSVCSYITTDKPVLVTQIVQSQIGTNEPSDPSLIIVPSIEQWLPMYSFTLPDIDNGTAYTNFVMIAVEKSQKNNILLDGATLSSGLDWCDIPTTEYTGTSLRVPAGYHQMRNIYLNKPFALLLYGVGNSSESFGYPAGMRLTDLTTCTPFTQTAEGDNKDNDCDGLVDEEICGDSIDNDGDGFSDEDCALKLKVNGNWGAWSVCGACSVTCGNGTCTRTRQCDSPAPVFSGDPCPGASTDSQVCVANPCPVDGVWSAYSPWGQCTKTCGTGTQTRTRTCTPPQHGGVDCVGNATESRECNTQACPVNGVLGPWSNWNQCSVTCGIGTRARSRTCTPPQGGGANCVGQLREVEGCTASCLSALGQNCTETSQCSRSVPNSE